MVEGDKVFPLLNYPCCHFVLMELCQHIASLKYTHKYFNFKAFLILPVLRCFLGFLDGLGAGGWVLLSFVVFCWWVVWGFGGCCLVFVLPHALDLPETSEQMYLFMNY